MKKLELRKDVAEANKKAIEKESKRKEEAMNKIDHRKDKVKVINGEKVKVFDSFDNYEDYKSKIYGKLQKILDKSVLHCRFTRKTFQQKLDEILSTMTKGIVTAEYAWNIEPQTSDYEVTVALICHTVIDASSDEVTTYEFGYIDTYYLKHRRKSDGDGNGFLITEFAINAD